VAAQLASGRFQAAMTNALQALDAGRLEAAEGALNRAAGERPRDPAVAAARTRLAEARRDRQLRDLLDQAQAAVADEQWAQAVTHYEAVQKIDPHHGASQTALRIVRPRAELAGQLAAFIDAPQRLASSGVRDDADRTLAAARALSPPGDRIQAQIDTLQRLVAQARTPVAVQLRSDNVTEVTVFRVGEQGRFSEKSLELLPGRYVAVGARSGYRDVRVEFEVAPGQPLSVAVRTEEPL
jgi:eukaryotic-like serine/threonine-protein kinase